jgi:hypothetical protein
MADWFKIGFALEQRAPGLLLLMAICLLLLLCAVPGKAMRACLPALVPLVCFFFFAFVGSAVEFETSRFITSLPLIGLVGTIVLLWPSITALRKRWVGVAHLMTVAASSYLWFAAAVAI